jgi:hypothetical protein
LKENIKLFITNIILLISDLFITSTSISKS